MALLAVVAIGCAACGAPSSTSASSPDQSFLAHVGQYDPSLSKWYTDFLIDAGRSSCAAFKSGDRPGEVANHVVDLDAGTSLSETEVSAIVTAAIVVYCPHFRPAWAGRGSTQPGINR